MCAAVHTRIQWDIGTAYDLFISLRALHDPDAFGVRASWAAGVRSRMPGEHRQTLDMAVKQINPPLFFVQSLPAPKNAASVINALKKLPASRVLETRASCSTRCTGAHCTPPGRWTCWKQLLLRGSY